MSDQTRNLNPTLEARVAMIIYGAEYAAQNGGSMDFWDNLPVGRKRRCELVAKEIRAALPKPDIQWPEKRKGKKEIINGKFQRRITNYDKGYNAGIDACIEAFNKWRES